MEFNIYALAIGFFLVFFVCPLLILMLTRQRLKLRKQLMLIFCCVYLIFLFLGTITQITSNFPRIKFDFNFKCNWFSISFLWFNFSLNNILINFFMFFPIGIFIYTFEKTPNFKQAILIMISISLIIEIYQFILPIYRDSELGDIILNTFGGVTAFGICKLLSKNTFDKNTIHHKT